MNPTPADPISSHRHTCISATAMEAYDTTNTGTLPFARTSDV
jgi:hypothetical protein